jgi:hypothetical protein
MSRPGDMDSNSRAKIESHDSSPKSSPRPHSKRLMGQSPKSLSPSTCAAKSSEVMRRRRSYGSGPIGMAGYFSWMLRKSRICCPGVRALVAAA